MMRTRPVVAAALAAAAGPTRRGLQICARSVAVAQQQHHQRATVTAVRALSTTTVARGLFGDYVKSTLASGVKEMSVKELFGRISGSDRPESLHIVDVRETYEWNEERLPHAVYSGRGVLERDIEGIVPNPYDEVVLYCAGGMRSVLAAESLKNMGYKNVYSLAGGIHAWKNAEFPTIVNQKTYSNKDSY